MEEASTCQIELYCIELPEAGIRHVLSAADCSSPSVRSLTALVPEPAIGVGTRRTLKIARLVPGWQGIGHADMASLEQTLQRVCAVWETLEVGQRIESGYEGGSGECIQLYSR